MDAKVMEYDDALEFFLDKGEAQWFEVWVDVTPTNGVRGVQVRGSMYGNIHFDENTTKISHFTWNCGGITMGFPNGEEAMRSLFA